MENIELMDGEKPFEENIKHSDNKEETVKDSDNNEENIKDFDNKEENIKDSDNKEENIKDSDNKEENIKDSDNKEENIIYDKKILTLTKDLSKANSWGHERNRLLTGGMKGLKEQLNKMVDENHIFKEDADNLLNCFNLEKIENFEKESTPPNKNDLGMKAISTIEKEVQGELNNYVKYTGNDKAENYYNCFFDNLSIFTPEKRIEIFDYLNTAENVDSLKYILHEGKILHDTIAEPLKEHSDILEYVNSLKNKIEKLEEKHNKLRLEKQKDDDYEDSQYIPVGTNKKSNKYDSYEKLFSL